MIVHDSKYLEYVRKSGPCWWCGKRCRVDNCANVVALGFRCHQSHHAGKSPTRAELWQMLDRRHGFEPGTCEAAVNELMRRDKNYQFSGE